MSARVLRSKRERAAVWAAADGQCAMCGTELGPGWHADHITPWLAGGPTELTNLQALCAKCNTRKGAKRMPKARSFWTNARKTFKRLIDAGEREAAMIIECGAGKSSIPPALVYDGFRLGKINGLIWAVPRLNLARQAADGMVAKPDNFIWQLLGVSAADAKRFEINHLENGNVKAGHDPSAGTFGYAVSYNSLASDLTTHLAFMRQRGRVMLVTDEVQFCQRGTATGNAIERLAAEAAFVLHMSGDFDRPNGKRIACVRYEEAYDDDGYKTNKQVVAADLVYNIYDALREKVILPIDFSYGTGSVAYYRGEERREYETFDDAGAECREALWAALNSDYARQLLTACVQSWRAHRTSGELPHRKVAPYPAAQLMVVCANKAQARELHQFAVSRLGFDPADCPVIVSPDRASDEAKPDAEEIKEELNAQELLKRFCAGKIPVAFTVAMAYVGTDAPRISHICVLTHYRTKEWLHQMLARAWRTAAGKTYTVAFTPNDPQFKKAVAWLKSAEQAGVDVLDDDDGEGGEGGDDGPEEPRDRVLITADASALTDLRHRYEITVDGEPGGPVSAPAPAARPPAPSEEATRTALAALGFSEEQIGAMLSAANRPPDPVTDVRPPAERIKSVQQELTKYLRQTARMAEKLMGPGADFQALVRETYNAMRRHMGRAVADLQKEPEFAEALTRYAPRVREEILQRAAR